MNESPINEKEFKKRLVDLLVRARFAGLPRKDRDRHIILKSIVLTMDADKEYSSSDVNESLRGWLGRVAGVEDGDHVGLRRALVDEGYMEREPDGSKYRVTSADESRVAFDPAIESIDVLSEVLEGRDFIERKKQEFMAKKAASK